MFKMILEKDVVFPDIKRHGIYISEDAKDLITKLMTKDPQQRLGSADDVDEVLSHKFFESLDLE